MRRDKKFDDILNECIERVLKGEPIGDCLAGYPEHAAALRPLLQTALNTRKAAEIAPRPEFRQRAANEFQAVLRSLPPQRQVSFRRQVRLVTVLSIIVVILMAGTGTVAAASNSLPDQPLYPVKLITEEVKLALTPSVLGKAGLYAEFTDIRIAEIVMMAEKGEVEQVVKTTERMNHQLIAMASLPLPDGESVGAEDEPQALLAAPAADTPVTAPTAFTEPQIMARAPVTLPASLEEEGQPVPSLDVTEPVVAARQGTGQVPAPAAANATALKSAAAEKSGKNEKNKAQDLKTALTRQAEENTRQLEDMLKRVPDDVKLALEKALEVAGNGYEEALRNIGRKK